HSFECSNPSFSMSFFALNISRSSFIRCSAWSLYLSYKDSNILSSSSVLIFSKYFWSSIQPIDKSNDFLTSSDNFFAASTADFVLFLIPRARPSVTYSPNSSVNLEGDLMAKNPVIAFLTPLATLKAASFTFLILDRIPLIKPFMMSLPTWTRLISLRFWKIPIILCTELEIMFVIASQTLEAVAETLSQFLYT